MEANSPKVEFKTGQFPSHKISLLLVYSALVYIVHTVFCIELYVPKMLRMHTIHYCTLHLEVVLNSDKAPARSTQTKTTLLQSHSNTSALLRYPSLH